MVADRLVVGACSPALAVINNCTSLMSTETFAYSMQVSYVVSTLAWGVVIAAALWRASRCGDLSDYVAAVLFSTTYVIVSMFVKCKPKNYAV